ncbi:PilZ domain-containing protein [Desulfoplanes sp.]
METERRTYTRIDTTLQAFMRTAPSPSARPGLRGGFATGVDHLKDDLQKTSLPDPLLDYLESMNAKLDTILGLLHQSSIQTEYPLTATVTQISGAGVQFTSDHDLQTGIHLEMVITLSRFPLYLINVVGAITRKETAPDGKDLYVFGFTAIRDNDREAIIQYVFREQREMIRGERL